MVKKVTTFKIAATYIGTIVGAGFASGQEILQFFSVFGLKGFWGLLIVTFLFILFGYVIMELGHKLNSQSHLSIIKHASGKYLGSVFDYLITFFLFGALAAMIAGSGAMFRQEFNIPQFWGSILMASVTAITVLTGINGVINSISFVVPFLLISAVGISVGSLFISPEVIKTNLESANNSELITNWGLASLLYTSYNTILAISILGPLGARAESKKALKYGAIWGGLGLGLGSLAIYFAIYRNISNVVNLEIPMVYIAGQISSVVRLIFIIVLIAEIYTTAVGSLYGFSARLTEFNFINKRLLIVGSTVLALISSFFGFSNLVKYLYPSIGYGGIILLLALLYSKFKTQKI